MNLRLSFAHWALVLLAALFAASLMRTLTAPPPDLAQFAAPGAHTATASSPGAVVSPSAFAEISQRALFTSSRKGLPLPEAADIAAGANVQTAPDIQLIGVVISPARRLAVIRASGEARSQNLALGASIGPWRLAQIEPDHIVFRRGDKDESYPLMPQGRDGARP